MQIDHSFIIDGDRYAFDAKLTTSNGYAQIDTDQDAWYYGNWCNPWKREIVTYAEGDLTIITAETDEEFVKQIRDMESWNKKSGRGMGIDPWFNEKLVSKFEEIGLSDLIH